jgi:hypothetical protein
MPTAASSCGCALRSLQVAHSALAGAECPTCANENSLNERSCHFCGTVLLKHARGKPTPPTVQVPNVIRLSQNRLTDLAGLPSATAPYLFLNQFSQLRVLDVSSNMLTELDPELMRAMPSLQCLLLHYNRFSSSTSLRPLGLLSKLEKLTVHGCPLHECLGKREFRHTVLSLTAPGLKQLDFTTVTIQEADDAKTSCEMKQRTRRQSLGGTLSRNPRIRAREMGGVTTMLRRPASRG